MKKEATKLEIRKMIMNQVKPFCLIDIYNRLEKVALVNRGLILEVLDELYEEHLVMYARLSQKMGNSDYAFVVDNDNMNKYIKKVL